MYTLSLPPYKTADTKSSIKIYARNGVNINNVVAIRRLDMVLYIHTFRWGLCSETGALIIKLFEF